MSDILTLERHSLTRTGFGVSVTSDTSGNQSTSGNTQEMFTWVTHAVSGIMEKSTPLPPLVVAVLAPSITRILREPDAQWPLNPRIAQRSLSPKQEGLA